ncbi:uncharacterized protein LOC129728760 [Wyeomyia smithii]|uniref:uncharacterized protein LOC129728760 n=1 Tax=Wyeomyia smithii TaxID=174621 RepID=UPI002467AD8C|nr:uncharacterized protein LOC129728760 [Wyeomyia smithii]
MTRIRARRTQVEAETQVNAGPQDEHNLISNANRRRTISALNIQLHRAAFQYDCTTDYSKLPCVTIGSMDLVCQHCNALKFHSETAQFCCAGGKVKLPPLAQPPEPLLSLLTQDSLEAKHFLTNVHKYNSCFQMTSFGANIVEESGFNLTFKIQGQIHHRTGSLLPPINEDHKFLQIYFVGNYETEIDKRCAINRAMKRHIIGELQELLHEHNALIRLFKTALQVMPSDDHRIVIRADKRPTGSHERQFNAPTMDEIAVVISGENAESRDIVLKRTDGQLQSVYETQRSYDSLQYPLMFCYGEDGYHFQIRMINPSTGEESNKKVSSMNFYSYRLMIRKDSDNHLLRYRRLFQQYAVDMYVKIETERLNFIKFNQVKLRSEEYVHLRDAISSMGMSTILVD